MHRKGRAIDPRQRRHRGLGDSREAADRQPDGDSRRHELPSPDHDATGRACRPLSKEAAHGLVDAIGLPVSSSAASMRKRGARATSMPRACSAITCWRRAPGALAFRAQHPAGPAGNMCGEPQAIQIVGVLGGPQVEYRLPASQRYAETAGHGRGIGRWRHHSRCQQSFVRGHATTARLGLGAPPGGRIDQSPDEKIMGILGWRRTASRPLFQRRHRRYNGTRIRKRARPRMTQTTLATHGHRHPLRRTKAAHE